MYKKFSLISIISLLILFTLIVSKEILYDIPTLIHSEKKEIKDALLINAITMQSHFSYFLQKNNVEKINKEIALHSLDKQHYHNLSISDNNSIIVFSTDESLVSSYIQLQKHKEIFIQYNEEKLLKLYTVTIPINNSYYIHFNYDITQKINKLQHSIFVNMLFDSIFMAFIIIMGMFLYYFNAVKPLLTLLNATKTLKSSNYDVHLYRKGFKEIKDLTSAFNTMAYNIKSDMKLITAQKEELERHQHELTKFNQVVEQSPSFVIMTDTNGDITYVNPSFCEALEYTQEELHYRKLKLIHSGTHNKKFYEEMWSNLREKNLWKGRIVNRTKSGKNITVESSIFALHNKENHITNYISIQQDITKQLENERAFAFQAKQAQMGEMISMIAHQWRQPLAEVNTIVANLELSIILEDLEDQVLTQNLEKIKNTNVYLSNTINDFRNFFKPNAATTKTSFEFIVNSSINLISHSIKSSATTVELDISTTSFDSFESELVQVVLNFLKNSLDIFHTNQKFERKQIKIFTINNEDTITLCYQDSAGGSDVKPIEDIFLPYFSTKKELDGTGLGLYMSKTIVEDHCKGKLEVQNIEEGIEFKIILPLKSL